MSIISATLKPTEAQAHAQLHLQERLARMALFISLARSLRYQDVDYKPRFLANSFKMVTLKGHGKSRPVVAVVLGQLPEKGISGSHQSREHLILPGTATSQW